MKLLRIRAPFPWRIAAILALVPCLPLLTSWAWIKWELPPLQRYYLAAYWDSSEGARQPGTQTQIRWLFETAPGRKSRWLITSDVTAGTQNGLPLELSSEALGQGWTGIDKSPAQSINSAELEGFLRESFYDGQSFRQLANEPLLYIGAEWLIVVFLVFVMRVEIGHEWRWLRQADNELEWGRDSGEGWTTNPRGIISRIWSGIARWNSKTMIPFSWVDFKAAIRRPSSVNQPLQAEILQGDDRPLSNDVRHERSKPHELVNPVSSHSSKEPFEGHTIFPGSLPSGAVQVQSKSWDESEWID
jgi:hypothetical protein